MMTTAVISLSLLSLSAPLWLVLTVAVAGTALEITNPYENILKKNLTKK
jgi:hypothetical protein